MHMGRLTACREFCGVHSWQNGTRCRDSVKVLWSHSRVVWLVFEASTPSFHEGKLFFDLFHFVFFLYCCLEMVREKKDGNGG